MVFTPTKANETTAIKATKENNSSSNTKQLEQQGDRWLEGGCEYEPRVGTALFFQRLIGGGSPVDSQRAVVNVFDENISDRFWRMMSSK